jgi:hypothetical protein
MHWSIFACGCIGSLAVEIANGVAHYRKQQEFPCYWDIRYFFLRSLLALFGGLLAVVLGAENHILAFHIGIGAPVILKAFEVNGEGSTSRKAGFSKRVRSNGFDMDGRSPELVDGPISEAQRTEGPNGKAG